MTIPQKLSMEKLAEVEGLSAAQAAKELGVSVASIRRWRGRVGKKPSSASVQGRRDYEAAEQRKKATAEAMAELETEAAQQRLVMTPKIAGMFARLLHAGCPAVQATQYINPLLSMEMAKHVTVLWQGSVEVRVAIEQLNGGAWVELAPERRYELALQKHLSEVAFFLHAHNFNDAHEREELEKFKQAREVLKAELKGTPDELDPMQAFARFALDLVKQQSVDRMAQGPREPDLEPPALQRMLRKASES